MLINFTKMHGLGNDFMVVDNLAADVTFNAEQIVNLANRHFGIGFDQLLVVETSSTKNVDFRYVIYNADGLEVEQCGNGTRCFARFVSEKGLSSNNPIIVETCSGIISLYLNNDNTVRVDMGKPSLNPIDIPLLVPQQSAYYQIEGFDLGVVSIGNPHCVILVKDVNTVDVSSIARKIQQSKLLPNQANIGFMQILNTHEINLRVYERGSGETLACGSGACAAVVYGVEQTLLKENVVAHLSGGDALIEYTQGGHVFLSGPAQFVFEGRVEI
ncbi:diaminopimelate epimerase [Candidatus Ruthia endofausta]|uniref:Diaminopimelate epimerase n=1 Tax=Candidatus Ruthia endofausta TaxID=2738852 RepID=A0A6N0HR38_9GAMM|nr:diaminopimelate epimerase [Candidatus Ruthia endofausta]QKQ24786.1 diaminopimelate epimerase [Candidatus Ruthia endofausta]